MTIIEPCTTLRTCATSSPPLTGVRAFNFLINVRHYGTRSWHKIREVSTLARAKSRRLNNREPSVRASGPRGASIMPNARPLLASLTGLVSTRGSLLDGLSSALPISDAHFQERNIFATENRADRAARRAKSETCRRRQKFRLPLRSSERLTLRTPVRGSSASRAEKTAQARCSSSGRLYVIYPAPHAKNRFT